MDAPFARQRLSASRRVGFPGRAEKYAYLRREPWQRECNSVRGNEIATTETADTALLAFCIALDRARCLYCRGCQANRLLGRRYARCQSPKRLTGTYSLSHAFVTTRFSSFVLLILLVSLLLRSVHARDSADLRLARTSTAFGFCRNRCVCPTIADALSRPRWAQPRRRLNSCFARGAPRDDTKRGLHLRRTALPQGEPFNTSAGRDKAR